MIILVPPIIFVGFLIIAFLLGLGSRQLAPKGPTDSESATSYAGGENIPGERKFPGYSMFYPLALFFTILHVLALLLGILPKDATGIGLLYAFMMVFALIAIVLK